MYYKSIIVFLSEGTERRQQYIVLRTFVVFF